MATLASLKAGVCALTILPLLSHALEPDKLFEKVSPSSWLVIAVDASMKEFSQGSAVVIGPGRLVTNCHIVKKQNPFESARAT